MNPTVAELILADRNIAYAISDRELIIVEVGGAVDLLFLDHKNWLGYSLLDLVPELVGSEAVLANILAGKLPNFELALINRDLANGETLYLTMVELPCRDQTGEITGLIHLVDDVTEMGLLDQRLAQSGNELRLLRDQLTRQNLELAAANAELQQLSELKSKFVSIAAHELRTPLTSISGYVEVLQDQDFSPLTEAQREYLEIVDSSVRRMRTITNNLLILTRIEAGQIELVLQPMELPALVKAATSEFAPQLETKAQRFTLHVPIGLPPALCDQARAAQIIGNLVSNAIKYTPTGGLISANVTLAEEEGFLQLSVADNGMGISVEDQAKLFNRFFRAERAQLTEPHGTGLGLYITRSLVELHGGHIWFESQLGHGSTFHVTFPVADQPTTI